MRVSPARPLFTASLLGAVVALTLSGCPSWFVSAWQQQRDEVGAAVNTREASREVYAKRCQPRDGSLTREQCLAWEGDLNESAQAIDEAILALGSARADKQVGRVRVAMEVLKKWPS